MTPLEEHGCHYVSFIDLTGYSSLVVEHEDHLVKAISDVCSLMEERTHQLNKALSSDPGISCRLLGDAFVIMMSCDRSGVGDLFMMIELVREIQSRLLVEFGLLVRGGISKGRVQRDGNGSPTGSGISAASKCHNDDNPSFLIAVDDSISSFVFGPMESASTPIYANPLSEIDGVCYVSFPFEGVHADDIISIVNRYQSCNPNQDNPRIMNRFLWMIDRFNETNSETIRYSCHGNKVLFGPDPFSRGSI